MHVIVEAEVPPERIMNELKAYASRELNRLEHGNSNRKRWTRHGSTRWLWKDQDVHDAIRYVVDEQESLWRFSSRKICGPRQRFAPLRSRLGKRQVRFVAREERRERAWRAGREARARVAREKGARGELRLDSRRSLARGKRRVGENDAWDNLAGALCLLCVLSQGTAFSHGRSSPSG